MLSGAGTSNLIQYADDFLEFQEKYHVNAVFAAAVTINECGAGTNCKIGGNNWFSITGNGGWRSYASPREAIEDFYKLIAIEGIYFANNKFTVSEIGNGGYCENADAPGGWIESVTSYMTNMFQAAGISVTPSGVGGTVADFLGVLEKYSQKVQSQQGQWKYSNDSPLSNTFEEAISNGGYKKTNCALMVNWGLIDVGVLKPGMRFYIKPGQEPTWSNSIKSYLSRYVDIKKVNKNAGNMISTGELQAGDICLWSSMGHTNVYAGNGKWYDAGRWKANGAKNTLIFKTFGPVRLPISGKNVTYLIRLKSN